MVNSNDPRFAASRARLSEAAREILAEEGPAAVTFARVAERSGIARATVYRHWADSDELLDEILDEFSLPFFETPGDPLGPWLEEQLRRLADELLAPATTRFATALIQRAVADGEAAENRRDLLFDTVERRLAAVVGLEPGGAESTILASKVVGPIVYGALLRGRRVPDALIAQTAQLLVSRASREC